jgi:hypothetical protein
MKEMRIKKYISDIIMAISVKKLITHFGEQPLQLLPENYLVILVSTKTKHT